MIWSSRRRRYASLLFTVPPHLDENNPNNTFTNQIIDFQPPRMIKDTKWLLRGFRGMRAVRNPSSFPYLDQDVRYYLKLVVRDERNRILFSDTRVGKFDDVWQKLFQNYTLGYAYWKPSDTIRTPLPPGYPADVTIQTRDKDILCHRKVLVENCVYFRNVFASGMSANTSKVVFDWRTMDYSSIVIEDMLRFLYTGQPPPNIEDTCFALIKLADFLIQSDLRLLCDFTMSHVIDQDNATLIWIVANKYDSKELKEAVVHFVLEKYGEFRDWNALDDEMKPENARKFCLLYAELKRSGKLVDVRFQISGDESTSDSTIPTDSSSSSSSSP